jgi:hypothetical protein
MKFRAVAETFFCGFVLFMGPRPCWFGWLCRVFAVLHIFFKTMTKKVNTVEAYIVETPDDGSF